MKIFASFVFLQFVCLVLTMSTKSPHSTTEATLVQDNKGAQPVIIGGQDALITDVPWIVGVNLDGFNNCGGSIINSRTILTAAHCLKDVTSNTRIQIRYNTVYNDYWGTVVDVTKWRKHENYHAPESDNDIALLYLGKSIPLNGKNTKQIRLPPPDTEVADDTRVLIAGWGYISANGMESNKLKKLEMKTFSKYKCRDIWKGLVNVTDNMICTTAPGKSACRGDSGGPLTKYPGNTQLGIASFAYTPNCSNTTFPNGFTRVSKYVTWIRRHQN